MNKIEGASKAFLNRKERKVGAKHTKINHWLSFLCDLCVIP